MSTKTLPQAKCRVSTVLEFECPECGNRNKLINQPLMVVMVDCKYCRTTSEAVFESSPPPDFKLMQSDVEVTYYDR